jgi:hypothetical protein
VGLLSAFFFLLQLMPNSYEESVKYLEGKRSLDKFLAEKY